MESTTSGGRTADCGQDSRPDTRADSSSEKRKPRPTGDVDSNGDLIYEQLVGRLRSAVGPDIADDCAPDEQVWLTLHLLETAPGPR